MPHRVPRTLDNLCTLGKGVEKHPSGIPSAGYGLFAARDFERGEYITYYDGERITRKVALERRQCGRDSHIRSVAPMHECIDGFTGETILYGRGCASLVNDNTDNNCALINSTWTPDVLLRATRDISQGEELFASYGKAYWTK